jgi:DNA polymerase (family 10)
MTNAEIAMLLREVAAAYSVKDEKKYRFQIIAYEKAADAIENSTTQVKDLIKNGKIEGLPGVGPTIASRLEELVLKGHVQHFEDVMKDIPPAMFPLLSVPSFGPKKAFKLVTHFKLKNPKTVLEDIKTLAEKGEIAKLEGFGEKSQADIERALGEFKKGAGKTTRMVLPYAAELAEKVVSYLKSSKDIDEAIPLGSLRRMRETIGDVDIAISTKDPKAAIEHFAKYTLIDRLIEKGPVSISALVSGGKQVDIIALPPESFGSLLQHFTGSKNHNVHLRELAIKKGLSLSERGIKRVVKGKEVLETFSDEVKFYKALGMDWIPPEMREDTGEIEKALEHTLPKLVELKDIKGDVHIHSNVAIESSHDIGVNTMEDMLNRAGELGYEYLGFSEHNPSVSKHTPTQIYDLLARRKEKIEKLNQKGKVKAIGLLEVDILPSGDLAVPDKAIELLDGMLVSIHSVFSMDKEQMTKRILAGLAHPKAKILTHPTGRLLGQRPGYEVDFEEIFAFCKRQKKAIEINAWPQRLDLPDSLVRQAAKEGIKFTIDTDSHATSQMDMMRFGVAVARRGWCTKDDILTTMPYNKFIEWLHS